jgi:apolipoprotein N-acyltransferase
MLFVSTIIASLFWAYSIMLTPEQPDPPAWLKNIAAISVIYPTQYPAISAVHDTSKVMKTILQNNPDVNVIVFPESSFHYDTLHHMQAVADAWSDAQLQKPVTVVAGAFRWDDTAYRNCVFCFDNGMLKAWYDKRHAMLLTESVPSWCHFDWLINMHCKDQPEIQPSTSPRPPFELTDDLIVTPYICSELYFSHHADDDRDDIPILFLGNDVWLEGESTKYMAYLMRLGATCRARAWQRDIMYITQLHAEFVSKEGHTMPLS